MNFRNRFRRRRRTSRTPITTLNDQLDPLRKLWMLRYLTLCGHKGTFIDKFGFDDDKIATALGFSECMDEDDDFSPVQATRELRVLTQQAEAKSSEARFPAVLDKNIKKLCRHIPLTECEQWILGFAVMAQEGSELHSILDGSLQATKSTLGTLLSGILGLPRSKVEAALDRNSSLYGSGLLKNESWEIKGGITEFLTPLNDEFANGLAHEDSDIVSLFRSAFRVAPTTNMCVDDFNHLGHDLEMLLRHAKRSMEQKKKGVNYLLYGAPGTGKTELSRVVADELRLPLHEIVVADDDGDFIDAGQRTSAFKSAQTYLRFSESLVVFDEADEILGSRPSLFDLFIGSSSSHSSSISKAWINRTLEENLVPTIWISNETDGVDQAILRRFDRVIEVPNPPRDQRERVLRKLVPEVDPSFARTVSAAADLTPAVLQKGVEFASAVVEPTGSDLWRKTAIDAINGTLRSQRFSTIKVNDPALLPNFYDVSFINTDVDLQALASNLESVESSRVCLFGPPGTGKTAFAKWCAERLSCTLSRVNASDLLSPYIGKTEQNIRDAFEQAERTDAILLFDEIDSFLFSRDRARHSWEVSQVNEFLAQLESFSGVLFATTNYENILDHASLRRFDLKVRFDYLRADQSELLIDACCDELDIDTPSSSDFRRLNSVDNLAPGDFATVLRQSKFTGLSSAQKLIDALIAECSLKQDTKQSIGFN